MSRRSVSDLITFDDTLHEQTVYHDDATAKEDDDEATSPMMPLEVPDEPEVDPEGVKSERVETDDEAQPNNEMQEMKQLIQGLSLGLVSLNKNIEKLVQAGTSRGHGRSSRGQHADQLKKENDKATVVKEEAKKLLEFPIKTVEEMLLLNAIKNDKAKTKEMAEAMDQLRWEIPLWYRQIVHRTGESVNVALTTDAIFKLMFTTNMCMARGRNYGWLPQLVPCKTQFVDVGLPKGLSAFEVATPFVEGVLEHFMKRSPTKGEVKTMQTAFVASWTPCRDRSKSFKPEATQKTRHDPA